MNSRCFENRRRKSYLFSPSATLEKRRKVALDTSGTVTGDREKLANSRPARLHGNYPRNKCRAHFGSRSLLVSKVATCGSCFWNVSQRRRNHDLKDKRQTLSSCFNVYNKSKLTAFHVEFVPKTVRISTKKCDATLNLVLEF